jgi:cytidylate kinase
MIITLDGPAGAGKSSVSRRLAQRLGYRFLDTGAMYRVLALAALERNIPSENSAALAELARTVRIELTDGRVLMDGRDVTDEIRTSRVTSTVHYVADNPGVRAELVRLQRQAAEGKNIVTEGRDQGTVAFPEAECKIYLTASPVERARRRMRELTNRGEEIRLDDLRAQIDQRDQRDAARPVGRLAKAEDAIEFVTDGLSLEQVVDRLEAIVRARCESRKSG